jgi:hypothetical protein
LQQFLRGLDPRNEREALKMPTLILTQRSMSFLISDYKKLIHPESSLDFAKF